MEGGNQLSGFVELGEKAMPCQKLMNRIRHFIAP
jgi:hypothetical protein